MADDDSKDFAARALPRIPLKLKVNMEFEKFSGFISEYSENISEGGMFVKTTTPRPMGSVFSLEFKLKDDYKLIQGWGEVVWVREKTEDPAKPAGMGIKFLDLDQASRELIRNIIRIHKKETGQDKIYPFEFMKEGEESQQQEKKPEGIDLSGITKEVFPDQQQQAKLEVKESSSQVEDIFKDLKTEINTDKEKADALSKPIVLTTPAAPEEAKEETPKATQVDNKGFVDSVFGDKKSKLTKDQLKKMASPNIDYQKVSWYANPSTVLLICIICMVFVAAALYHKKLLLAFNMAKSYLAEQHILFKPPLAPAKQAVSLIVVKTETPVATAIVEATAIVTPAAQKTSVATTPVTTPKPSESKVAEVPKTLPTDLLILKEVKLENLNKSNYRVNFIFSSLPDKSRIIKEMIPSPPPRFIVKVPGVKKVNRLEYSIHHVSLTRIRLGLHPDALHIVFDLGSKVTQDMISITDTPRGFSFLVSKK
jgi:uncharacterized protein (TIGR02266 family)